MAPGSQKDLGYFSIGALAPTMIVLCESGIDAMSCFLLHPSSLCVSTSGAWPNLRWLPSLLSEGYAVYCGFDADPTGDDIALRDGCCPVMQENKQRHIMRGTGR